MGSIHNSTFDIPPVLESWRLSGQWPLVTGVLQLINDAPIASLFIFITIEVDESAVCLLVDVCLSPSTYYGILCHIRAPILI